jgi:hypothetical protein
VLVEVLLSSAKGGIEPFFAPFSSVEGGLDLLLGAVRPGKALDRTSGELGYRSTLDERRRFQNLYEIRVEADIDLLLGDFSGHLVVSVRVKE